MMRWRTFPGSMGTLIILGGVTVPRGAANFDEGGKRDEQRKSPPGKGSGVDHIKPFMGRLALVG